MEFSKNVFFFRIVHILLKGQQLAVDDEDSDIAIQYTSPNNIEEFYDDSNVTREES